MEPEDFSIDPRVQIRARRFFTGGWFLRWWAMTTIGMGGVLILGEIAFGVPPVAVILSLLPIAVLGCLFLATGRHNRRLVARILRERHGMAEIPAGAFIAELIFEERQPVLKKALATRMDNADDLGVLICDGDELCFLGDSTCIQLGIADIAGIQPNGSAGEFGYMGKRTRVAFADRLSGQAAFSVVIREGFWLIGAWRRAAEMQRAMIDWLEARRD